jgi:glucose-6-phosphate 1-dehydrogenase
MTYRLHDTLLHFGATGDLLLRYLFPPLVNLLTDRLLPAGSRGPAQADDFLPVTVYDKMRTARNP